MVYRAVSKAWRAIIIAHRKSQGCPSAYLPCRYRSWDFHADALICAARRDGRLCSHFALVEVLFALIRSRNLGNDCD
jgi:hypothetical protein